MYKKIKILLDNADNNVTFKKRKDDCINVDDCETLGEVRDKILEYKKRGVINDRCAK